MTTGPRDDVAVVVERIAASAAMCANPNMSRATTDRVARELCADVEVLRDLLGQNGQLTGDD